MQEQLTFFKATPVEQLQQELQQLKHEWVQTRKSLYARHANLMHLYLEQGHEINELKKELHKVA